jgi:hypothetical protein
MSLRDRILDAVKNQLGNRAQEGDRKSTSGGLFGKLTDILGQRTRRRDPMSNVRPASEDPYGDPADEARGRNVRPASEDPYGDPADEPRRRS